jgi:hypothetical protein
MGRSPVQGVLLKRLKGFVVQKLILNRNRPEDLIRETYNKNELTSRNNQLLNTEILRLERNLQYISFTSSSNCAEH